MRYIVLNESFARDGSGAPGRKFNAGDMTFVALFSMPRDPSVVYNKARLFSAGLVYCCNTKFESGIFHATHCCTGSK